MPCDPVKLPSGVVAIACSRGPRKRGKCSKCGRPSSKLCDFVTKPAVNHVLPVTCDKPLCDACAIRVGPNRDHCPDHPKAAGAQLPLGGL